MNFNFDNDRPIYIQLTEKLKSYIITGNIKLGEKIPSVRDLALSLKVNPNTVQKSLNELEDEGLIFTERTNGKFVTTNKKLIEKEKNNLAKNKVLIFIDEMNNLGLTNEEIINYLQQLGGEK